MTAKTKETQKTGTPAQASTFPTMKPQVSGGSSKALVAGSLGL